MQTSDCAVREKHSSPKHVRRDNSLGKDKRPPSPAETVDPYKDQDMHAGENQGGSADTTDLAMEILFTISLTSYFSALNPFNCLARKTTLLNKLKQADIDFQQKVPFAPFENWHETIDDNILYLHKNLGMPINLTVSPHFYYQAA
jgi:hypothetical protein